MLIVIIYAVLAVSSISLLHYFFNRMTAHDFPYLWETETERQNLENLWFAIVLSFLWPVSIPIVWLTTRVPGPVTSPSTPRILRSYLDWAKTRKGL